jgi:hypothetical protein
MAGELVNEFGMLHIKLADLLGDPRTAGGTPLASITSATPNLTGVDGIAWTTLQRSRLLNTAIKWYLGVADIATLLTSIPFGDVTGGTNILSIGDNGSYAAPVWTASNSILRMFYLHAQLAGGGRIVTIPIISPLSRQFRIRGHPHWDGSCYGVFQYRDKIYLFNPSVIDTTSITGYYIRDFSDISTDINIGIPSQFHGYILAYALHLARMYTQRVQEGLIVKNDALQELQLIKQGVK